MARMVVVCFLTFFILLLTGKSTLAQEKKHKNEYRSPECLNVPDNGIIRKERFIGVLKGFVYGDYLHAVFVNEKGEEVFGPFLDSEAACFLVRHVGEKLEVLYNIECKYIREGGWCAVEDIIQIIATEEDYLSWKTDHWEKLPYNEWKKRFDDCQREIDKLLIDKK